MRYQRPHPALRCVYVFSLSLVVGAGWFAAAGGARADYTAAAWLWVAAEQPWLVVADAGATAAGDFSVFKNTQMQLIKSRFVLSAVLRKPEIRKLNIAQRYPDPIGWLTQAMRVDSPGNSEIVQVSLTSPMAQEAVDLVNATVEVYVSEIVEAQRNRRLQRLNSLDRIYAEKEDEVRERRVELKILAETLGFADSNGPALKQQIALDEFAELQKQRIRRQFELQRAKDGLKLREVALKAAEKAEIPESELDQAVHFDAAASQVLIAMFGAAKRDLSTAQQPRTPPQPVAPELEKSVRELEEQIAQRRDVLRQRLRQEKLLAIKTDIERLQGQIAVLSETARESEKEVLARKAEAEKLRTSSVDLDMARARLQDVEEAFHTVAKERERLRIEIRAPARVSLLQLAELPGNAE